MGDDRLMSQQASHPLVLEDLVKRLSYRDWRVALVDQDRGQGSKGLTLEIITRTTDSYDSKNKNYRVRHSFIVPAAAYNEQSWRRWLLNRFIDVETHEACEFFKVDGKRPYAPHHGPGNDPYVVFERGTDEEARTMYTGEVR